MGHWYVNIENEAKGPFDEAMLIKMVGGGLGPETPVSAGGTEKWVRLDSLPFYDKTRSPDSVAGARSTSKMAILEATTGIIAAVAPILIGVFGYLLHSQAQQHGATIAAMSAQLSELNTMVTFGETSAWVDLKNVEHNCVASNNEASCTFTNGKAIPVTTCARARLTKKEATGIKLESLPMCTGRLGPRETKTVSAPWVGGFAKDACSSSGRFGEVLDWSACNFTTDGVDLSPPAPSGSARGQGKK